MRMSRITRISSLGRMISPRNSATAWALSTSLVIGVFAGYSHGADSGIRGGVAAFLAWAIVRELAPQRALASLLAPLAAIAFAIPAESDLLACSGVLLAARIAARTVGAAPTLLDCMLLVPLAGYLAMRPEGLPVALVLAAVVFADAPPARLRWTGLVALAATMVVGSLEGTLIVRTGWDDPVLAEQILLALTLVAALALIAWPLPHRLALTDDRGREQLHGPRIRMARIVTFASVAAAMLWTGVDGAFALSSAGAALLAAGLGGLGVHSASDTLAAERTDEGSRG